MAKQNLPELKNVRTTAGDYNEADLELAVNTNKLVGNIIEHWMSHAKGMRTVVFATSVNHSKHICDRFKEARIPAEHLDGKTPKPERDAILKRLETGETLVVCNCGVLCEGWDQPAVKCAILARPTKSTALYIQQAGRILRPYDNQQAIILDHAGCVHVHGLIDQERQWSLGDKKKRNKAINSTPPIKICPECHFGHLFQDHRIVNGFMGFPALAEGGMTVSRYPGHCPVIQVPESLGDHLPGSHLVISLYLLCCKWPGARDHSIKVIGMGGAVNRNITPGLGPGYGISRMGMRDAPDTGKIAV